MDKTPPPETVNPSLTKNNWIFTQHYDQIPEWDWHTCLAFLSLSETSQHKLPGSNLTTAKVRRRVVDRLQSIILSILKNESDSPPKAATINEYVEENWKSLIKEQLTNEFNRVKTVGFFKVDGVVTEYVISTRLINREEINRCFAGLRLLKDQSKHVCETHFVAEISSEVIESLINLKHRALMGAHDHLFTDSEDYLSRTFKAGKCIMYRASNQMLPSLFSP